MRAASSGVGVGAANGSQFLEGWGGWGVGVDTGLTGLSGLAAMGSLVGGGVLERVVSTGFSVVRGWVEFRASTTTMLRTKVVRKSKLIISSLRTVACIFKRIGKLLWGLFCSIKTSCKFEANLGSRWGMAGEWSMGVGFWGRRCFVMIGWNE